METAKRYSLKFLSANICRNYATFTRQDLESDRTKCNYVFIFHVILIPLFKFLSNIASAFNVLAFSIVYLHFSIANAFKM